MHERARRRRRPPRPPAAWPEPCRAVAATTATSDEGDDRQQPAVAEGVDGPWPGRVADDQRPGSRCPAPRRAAGRWRPGPRPPRSGRPGTAARAALPSSGRARADPDPATTPGRAATRPRRPARARPAGGTRDRRRPTPAHPGRPGPGSPRAPRAARAWLPPPRPPAPPARGRDPPAARRTPRRTGARGRWSGGRRRNPARPGPCARLAVRNDGRRSERWVDDRCAVAQVPPHEHRAQREQPARRPPGRAGCSNPSRCP